MLPRSYFLCCWAPIYLMLINSFKAAPLSPPYFFCKVGQFFETKISLVSQFEECVRESANWAGSHIPFPTYVTTNVSLSLSSQFWYWLIFHTKVLQKENLKKTLNRLKESSGSTVKTAGRCAQPCPRLCHCLSHLHLGRTGSVLCPGTVPKKLLWMNSPRWLSSLHAVTSSRSLALLLVTHSAPGDRYYILYHSLCTSSRGTCLLARTHTHMHMHAHARQLACGGREEAEGVAQHKNRPRPDHNTKPSLFLPHPSPTQPDKHRHPIIIPPSLLPPPPPPPPFSVFAHCLPHHNNRTVNSPSLPPSFSSFFFKVRLYSFLPASTSATIISCLIGSWSAEYSMPLKNSSHLEGAQNNRPSYLWRLYRTLSVWGSFHLRTHTRRTHTQRMHDAGWVHSRRTTGEAHPVALQSSVIAKITPDTRTTSGCCSTFL